jgi:hypothetical protein
MTRLFHAPFRQANQADQRGGIQYTVQHPPLDLSCVCR